MFLIGNRTDPSLFWSVNNNWSDQDNAVRYTSLQQNTLGLPVNGYWVPLWSLDLTQFARFIAECEAAGVFTPQNLEPVCDSMDLEFNQILSIIDRAQNRWEQEIERIR